MDNSCKNYIFYIFGLALFSLVIKAQPNKQSWLIKNPFEQKNFIANKGQILPINNLAENKVLFETFIGSAHYLFCKSSIIICKKNYVENSEEEIKTILKKREVEFDEEKEEEFRYRIEQISEIYSFNNTAKDLTITANNRVSNYYTYRDSANKTIIANAYKTIIYTNIYPNIDLTFSFHPDSSFINYSFLLKPGANLNDITIGFNKNTTLKINDRGSLIAESDNFKTQFYIPKLFDNTTLDFNYAIFDNCLKFNRTNNKISQSLTINGWINNNFNLTGNNGAFDVDYDRQGNVYIYGGSNQYTLNKYDNNGNLLWTHTPFGTDEYMYGDFAVDRNTGNIYIVEGIGLLTGAQIAKLNSAGNTLAFYTDNNCQMCEIWRIVFDPCTNVGLMVGGGSGCGTPYQSCLLDTNLITFSPINFVYPGGGYGGDESCLAIDNFGHCYHIMNNGYNGYNNKLLKFNMSNLNNVTYSAPTGFNLLEYSSTYFHKPESYLGNGLNGLTTSNTHVYSYDGFLLKKYKASDLTILKSKTIENGDNSKLYWSGIAANDCDILLIADKKNVLQLDTSFNITNTYAMPDFIYDIRYNNNGTIYICGNKFLSVFNSTGMNCLNNSFLISQPDSCRGIGSASVSISGGMPPYNITWNTLPVQTGSVVANLTPGSIYNVTVQDNYPCSIHTKTDTIKILYPSTFILESEIALSTCIGINNGNISLSPIGGNSPYYYDWSNGIKGLNLNYISGLATGIYSVTATDNLGCISTATIAVGLENNFKFSEYIKVNIFTPNSDDINDIFYPIKSKTKSMDEISNQIETYQLSVFDRWGTLIFESTKLKQGWDGYNTSGLICADGIYFWVLNIFSKCSKSEKEKINGFVQLIR